MLYDPIIGWTSALTLSSTFAAAAIPKLREPARFEAAVIDHRMVPRSLVRPFARALPIAELAAAAMLLAPASRAAGAMLTLLLLVTFGLAVTTNLLRGRRSIECGCGEPGTQLSSALLGRILVLAALAGVALSGSVSRQLAAFDLAAIAAMSAALVLLHAASTALLAMPQRKMDGR